MRYLITTCVLFLLVGGSGATGTTGAAGAAGAAPVVELRVPPFPQDLDLRSVERLYKSAAYKVEVRQRAANANINAEADVFKQTFVFETRNDWVMHDYFNKNPDRRRDVLSPAERVGHTADLPAHVDAAKADLQTASFTQFSFANTAVEVRITLLGSDARAQHVTVRPLRFAVPARISADGRVISFTLDRPRKVSVEINDRLNPLFVFADAPDVPDTAATHYFGPGLHRIPGSGTLQVKSGERVYIAAGAIVEGRLRLDRGSSNITIRGRGLLSGGEWPELQVKPAWQMQMAAIWADSSHHLLIEGITLVQSTTWQVAIEDFSPKGDATHHNQYRNLKTVSWNGCTDGIWVTGNNNVVDDVFIFNNDDAFVSKGGRNTTISNAVFWGGTWGRLMLFHNIYAHTPPVENLLLENIDVIGKEGTPHFIYLEGWGTPARRITKPMRNVSFRNIVFEERRRPGNSNNNSYQKARLIDFDTATVAGAIENLVFDNISLDQKLADEGALLGTALSPIKGVTLRGITAGGEPILRREGLRIRFNEHVSGIRFE